MSLLGCNDPEEPPFANLEQAVTEVASGLSNPWGLAFLPDGRALVTERFGALRILNTNGTLSAPLAGVPEVFAVFQGGMLDVAVDDNFENNNLVYLSYSEPGDNNTAGTALGRGILQDNALLDFQILFRENPKRPGGTHFGSRILFDEGYLFLTLSDRNHTSAAQDLSNHQGTIVRIWPDGTVPLDNPYANDSGAMPEIWSYGHRNVQGAAINPVNGDFWISEMGPQGGDEINKVLPASNYGWPLVSWGDEYGGAPIPNPDTRPDLQDAALWWSPSVAPSGVEFYTGSMFSQWQGRLLVYRPAVSWLWVLKETLLWSRRGWNLIPESGM